MMKFKTDWNENDFVNVDDFNRIRTNLALLSSDGGTFSFPSPVDASYVITEDDIFELRRRYEDAARNAGILSDGPSDWPDYVAFDPSRFEGEVYIFPRLISYAYFRGDSHCFPSAWELNLIEKLCKCIAEYSPQCSGQIYAGGVIAATEIITISN
jgi:hypothetical protein